MYVSDWVCLTVCVSLSSVTQRSHTKLQSPSTEFSVFLCEGLCSLLVVEGSKERGAYKRHVKAIMYILSALDSTDLEEN